MKFTKYILVLTLLVFGVTVSAKRKWWETASFYQIYPRSFKDSDGNGIGDLNGITENLPYLKEIGIDATWLSPIFPSPMADFGYDISNFTDIDPIFGTMADFDKLIERAKAVGIKIIVDFVPNHSSDECEWFIKSVNGDPTYKDFYIWHPGKIINGTRYPPTNWISYFRGSQWTWNEKRQAYYLHQFHYKQPDFNYRNPKVREMMREILRFWLYKGVSGFRVDAVPFLYETDVDENGEYPDEPRNEAVTDPEDYESLLHIHTNNLPETTLMVYEFRNILDEVNSELGGDDRILMTEAYAPIDVLMGYYGNDTVEGSQIPFNFEIINDLTNSSNAQHYEEVLHRWLDKLPKNRVANWVLGNHDRKRVGTRMNADRIDMMNILLFSLPGCKVTYYGEEIGMTDVWISWEDTVDPQGCQSNPVDFERLSRDPVRTPFQWNNNKQAGFTSGNATWLPVADNYNLVNVKRQRGIALSHINIFKQLQNLKLENTIANGSTDVIALNKNVLVIKRSLPGDYTFITLMNIMDDVEMINLHEYFSNLTDKMEYYLVTEKSFKRKGQFIETNSVILMPKEAIVLRTNDKIYV